MTGRRSIASHSSILRAVHHQGIQSHDLRNCSKQMFGNEKGVVRVTVVKSYVELNNDQLFIETKACYRKTYFLGHLVVQVCGFVHTSFAQHLRAAVTVQARHDRSVREMMRTGQVCWLINSGTIRHANQAT